MIRQMALECIGFDDNGRLVRIAGPSPDDIPLIYVAFVGGEWLRFCRYDVSNEVCAQLNGVPSSQVSRTVIAKIAQSDGAAIWEGSAYHFAGVPAVSSNLQLEKENGRFRIRTGNKVVCEAWSSREDDFAAELAVETVEGYRRLGYGKVVAAAWATEIIMKGKVAFYSHRDINIASSALAHSLGVERFMTVICHG